MVVLILLDIFSNSQFLPRVNELESCLRSWKCGLEIPLFRLNADGSVNFHEKKTY